MYCPPTLVVAFVHRPTGKGELPVSLSPTIHKASFEHRPAREPVDALPVCVTVEDGSVVQTGCAEDAVVIDAHREQADDELVGTLIAVWMDHHVVLLQVCEVHLNVQHIIAMGQSAIARVH